MTAIIMFSILSILTKNSPLGHRMTAIIMFSVLSILSILTEYSHVGHLMTAIVVNVGEYPRMGITFRNIQKKVRVNIVRTTYTVQSRTTSQCRGPSAQTCT